MRQVLGGLSLIYKLYVGAVFIGTLILLYPLFLIVLSRKSWRRFSFPLNVLWSHLFRLLAFIQPWKMRRVTLPEGPYMIIANHASYLDIFLMYSLLPKHRFLFMGKSEILTYPLLKTYFKRLNIPVDRNNKLKAAKSFIQAKQAMKDGWSIVIFPEGGVPNENPQMIPFKTGAFKLAKSANVSIVPMTFLDNYHLFSDPTHILGPAHPGISRVIMHDVIPVERIQALTEQALSDEVFEVIAGPLRERGLMR